VSATADAFRQLISESDGLERAVAIDMFRHLTGTNHIRPGGKRARAALDREFPGPHVFEPLRTGPDTYDAAQDNAADFILANIQRNPDIRSDVRRTLTQHLTRLLAERVLTPPRVYDLDGVGFSSSTTAVGTDFLHNDEIEDVLYAHMPRDRWVPLAELYALIEQRVMLTDADLEPAASRSGSPRWQRNVRNLLQSRKRSGGIEWDGDANYRLAPHADRPEFEVGRVYRRQGIHDRYGGQRYGGISTPSAHPVVFLISGEEGAAFGYDDELLGDGTLLYFGEGQTGPMSFTRGNGAVRDHADAGEDLLLFRKIRDGFVRYVGQYVYAGHELRPDVRDVDGNPRTAIVFQLVPHDQLVYDEEEGNDEVEGISDDDLTQLRAAALETPEPNRTPAEGRRKIWKRSRAVRKYALLRARGTCEGCATPAPFMRIDGTAYLEPHHTRRISDSGPDHPRWVIALCPTCHRRVHYGADGHEYNEQLEATLSAIEKE
jgi:5-methylcytosine-specific restriction protein A